MMPEEVQVLIIDFEEKLQQILFIAEHDNKEWQTFLKSIGSKTATDKQKEWAKVNGIVIPIGAYPSELKECTLSIISRDSNKN